MRVMLSRRRFLAITGAAAVAGRGSDAAPVARWQGPALGTLAEVRLIGIETPGPIFAAIEAELGRIDRLFSLYRADSALVQLNRDGVLARPDPAFLELLTIARSVHHATEGAFDPTVQPLFALHWFNPLGWVGWRAMRRDQEAACDARVVERCDARLRETYASTIASFATRSDRRASLALAAIALSCCSPNTRAHPSAARAMAAAASARRSSTSRVSAISSMIEG